jgi:mRNA interferase RelE/StbE
MASFRVSFRPSVAKDLRRLPRNVAARIVAAIGALESSPFPRGAAKLSGAEELYRLRVGDYRVVYGVDASAHTIMIHRVRHRREVYQNLN